MAKTLKVSDNAYEELKKLKEKNNKSFSEIIMGLVNRNENKTVYNLQKHFGILKGDKEYKKIQKELKKGWSRWQKRYSDI